MPDSWPLLFLHHHSCTEETGTISASFADNPHLQRMLPQSFSWMLVPPLPWPYSVPLWGRCIARCWGLWSLVCLGGHNKIPQARWLKQTFIFSHFWMLDVHGQVSSEFDFWWELSSWLAHGDLLPVSSQDHSSVYTWEERTLAFIPLLIRTPVPLDWGPTLMTSFDLNYLHKGPVSKYGHIGSLGFSVWIWGWGGYNSVHNS